MNVLEALQRISPIRHVPQIQIRSCCCRALSTCSSGEVGDRKQNQEDALRIFHSLIRFLARGLADGLAAWSVLHVSGATAAGVAPSRSTVMAMSRARAGAFLSRKIRSFPDSSPTFGMSCAESAACASAAGHNSCAVKVTGTVQCYRHASAITW